MGSPFIKSPLEMLYDQANIPHLANGGNPPMPTQKAMQLASQYTGTGPMPDLSDYTPPEFIPAYRPDVKGKYGGKQGLETMPTYFDKMQIQDYVKAMRAGEPHGVPQLPPEYLTNLLLREGRSDFGFNEMNARNKKAMDISKILATSGQHEDEAAEFAGALYDKMQTAMRLKKPFTTVWNGTGVNDYGQSGNTYSAKFTQGFPATMHAKNEPLLAVVREAYNYQPPAPQAPVNYMPNVDVMGNVTGYSTGGSVAPKSFYDMSKLLIQKHLSGK